VYVLFKAIKEFLYICNITFHECKISIFDQLLLADRQ